MFKYSLISDMHVDHPQKKTSYDKLEEFVIVAGDTANGLLGLKFLEKLKRRGHIVFAVDGNHEHYSNINQGRTQEQTRRQFYGGLDQKDEVYLTDEKIALIGCNGWYTVSDGYLWSHYMNDSRYCGISAEGMNMLALNEYDFVLQCLESLPSDYKAIVVTHTAPCEETLNPDYGGHFSNEWYWNPHMKRLLSTFSDKILVWNHGHTHARNEAVVDGVRVVCNPRGYPGENPGWEPLTVEV